MKKQLKLRGWVIGLILIINLFSVLGLASDCNNIFTFIVSKIVFISIFIVNYMILNKYTNIFD